jgi:hypothetical protein
MRLLSIYFRLRKMWLPKHQHCLVIFYIEVEKIEIYFFKILKHITNYDFTFS